MRINEPALVICMLGSIEPWLPVAALPIWRVAPGAM